MDSSDYTTPTEACQPGTPVIFTDPSGNDHNAVVTAGWTPTCANVVFVSGDNAKQDGYGRQIEGATSVPHVSQVGVHGYYYRFASEPKRPYTPPAAV